MMNSELSKL